MASRGVWITGIGLITPIGDSAATFWDSLVGGRSGAHEVRSFDVSALPNRIGCEIESYSVPEHLRDALRGGRCTELAAVAAHAAVESSGLRDRLAGPRTAVIVGTTMGEVTQFEQDRLAHADREPNTEDVHSLAHRPLDVMARSLASAFGITGPVVTAPAACAAGSYAIGMAATMVARGQVERALAVGCEAFSRLAFVGFSRMRAMSDGICRPFSLERPGLLLGEGAGAAIVESDAAARERGAECWGSVMGFGLSCDAHHVTGPHPAGKGAARAMRDALQRGKLDRSSVDYVNAHGTGTALNDRTESLAVREVFGDATPRLAVSSIKALTGHMMGAAGAVEAIASLLAMRHGVIPPTWNWQAADPECDIDCVPNEPRETRLQHVLSNSYAFGGNNASLLLGAPGR